MVNLLGNILCSSVKNLFDHQPDIFSFTHQTGETEWNLGHHLANEIHKYIFWLNCDLDLTKANYSNRRPDIVFHKRGTHALNFLVVELKQHSASSGEDIRRIKEDWMGSNLHYRFGASINISNMTEYKVIVFHWNAEREFNQASSYIAFEKPSLSKQVSFVSVVDQILIAKKKDPSADTPALEAEIDQLVYALCGLTPEEIEIVEARNADK
jgi:hypothetical protein